MKQIIEIEVPEGKKAIWKDNKVVFEDIKLPKTWSEFCKYYHVKEGESFIEVDSKITVISCKSDRNSYSDKNILPNEESAKQYLALMQLHQLRDCYRQGWKPDWKNKNSTKYAIVYSIGGELIVDDYALTPIFLSFQSEKLAKQFLNNFRDLIEKAGDLI